MIKILHVVPTTSQSSGIMSVLMSYYRRIDRKKIQFDFLCLKHSNKNFDKEIVSLGGKVYTVNNPSIHFKRDIKNFFLQHNNEYLVLHCHPIFSFYFYSNPAKKYGNIKHIIQHSHTTKYSDKITSSIRNRIIMNFAPILVTDYAACSTDALKCLPKKDILKKGYKIINNAIDTSKFVFNNESRISIRKELKIDEDTTVIGHVGRFVNQKNHMALLDIYNLYHKKDNNSKLLLVGSGILESKIKLKAKKLGIYDSIIFVGVRNDVENLFCAMDYFILPSRFEGLGIVAIEAQTSGLITFCSSGVPKCALITKDSYSFNVHGKKDIDLIINKMINSKNYIRSNNQTEIINAGYDINYETRELQKFYLNFYNRGDKSEE